LISYIALSIPIVSISPKVITIFQEACKWKSPTCRCQSDLFFRSFNN